MTLLSPHVLRFNLAAHSADLRVLARFASVGSPSFDEDIFIAGMSKIENFPFVTIRETLQTVNAAGGQIEAKRVELAELRGLRKPILVYLNRPSDLPHSNYILQLEHIDDDRVSLIDHRSRMLSFSSAEFAQAYVGIAYLHAEEPVIARCGQPALRSDITKLTGFLSTRECRQLHDLCSSFDHYLVPSSEIAPMVTEGAAAQASQSFGTALDLTEDHGGIVAQLMARSADVCGAAIGAMEGLHCKRLTMADYIPARFDNGVNLQRLRAIHCVFGDDVMLEITETSTGRRIDLHAGDAILVTCADHFGRTRWRSEWSAVPRQGVAFLSSCWQRSAYATS